MLIKLHEIDLGMISLSSIHLNIHKIFFFRKWTVKRDSYWVRMGKPQYGNDELIQEGESVKESKNK